MKAESQKLSNLLVSNKFADPVLESSPDQFLIEAFTSAKLVLDPERPGRVALAPNSMLTDQQVQSKYREYKENKNKLVNMGITRLLDDRQENEELQRYLAEKSYDSASLGETSADELSLVNPSISSGDLEIYRENVVSKSYDEAKELAAKAEAYETEVVREHLNLDLFRRYGKS